MKFGQIKNGFRKAGIHPYNKFVIERERFDPLSLSRWDNRDLSQVHGESNSDNMEQTDVQSSQEHYNQQSSSFSLQLHEHVHESTDIHNNVSFESLLINSLKQIPATKTTKRKVVSGAQVITSEEAINIMKKKDEEKNKPKKKKKNQEEENPLEVVEDHIQQLLDQNLDYENEILDDNLLENITQSSDESDLLNELEREILDKVDDLFLNTSEYRIGDWVLVEYKVAIKGQKNKFYVGIIEDIKDKLARVRFLKLKSQSRKSTTFIYPVIEDIDDKIELTNINCHLPQPKVGRRGELVLMISFDQYNLR